MTDVLRFLVELLLVLNAHDVLDSTSLKPTHFERSDDWGVFHAACAAPVGFRYTNTTQRDEGCKRGATRLDEKWSHMHILLLTDL